MKLGIVIIDDEKDAIEAIESTIKLSGTNYEILATTTNPLEGIGLILKHKPEIVFLDVEMPQLDGFEMLESIPEITFEIVFVTAYEQYAIRAIKNNAADYILKPVSVNEVATALKKIDKRITNNNSSKTNYKSLIEEIRNSNNERIKISTCGGFELIEIDHIINIEAQGVYSSAYLNYDNKVLITKPLKEIEKQLNSPKFFRVHRSHLVNINFIKRYESGKNSVILSNGKSVPLARRRIEQFKEKLDSLL